MQNADFQKILMLPAHTQIATQSGGQIISTGVMSMSMMANTMKKHNLIPHQMNQRIFNAALVMILSKFEVIDWGRKMNIGIRTIESKQTNKYQMTPSSKNILCKISLLCKTLRR